MISIFIFYIHFVGAVYAFVKGYVDHSVTDGFMTLAFVAIIFSVGWTIAGFIVRFFLPAGGFGPWLDSDTISLIIVSILEALLYLTYFKVRKKKQATETAS